MKAGKDTVTASKAYATELEAINMKDTLTPYTTQFSVEGARELSRGRANGPVF